MHFEKVTFEQFAKDYTVLFPGKSPDEIKRI